MNVCVFGLWHLGSVTAACLAEAGFDVVGLDTDSRTVGQLKEGIPPLFEPGLEERVRTGLRSGRLRFTDDPAEALRKADLLWVTFDTPVDAEDRADTEFVVDKVREVFPHLTEKCAVLVSSQIPVGTTARIERLYADAFPDRTAGFHYSPENLRLGKAIEAFTKPTRVVVGSRGDLGRETVASAFRPFCGNLLWMSAESAEMVKHALNAFLATSVAFINEIAVLCETTGADPHAVERGLKSEPRIGPNAYLKPGTAFAGGTLARDIRFLTAIARERKAPMHLLTGVLDSNTAHLAWPQRAIERLYPDLSGVAVTILGLAYKPGTDTLRRSSAIPLAAWLLERGAYIRAHDPAVQTLPEPLAKRVLLCRTAGDALDGTEVAVLSTEWPVYRELAVDEFLRRMKIPVVIDPGRFLQGSLGSDSRIRYISIGTPA